MIGIMRGRICVIERYRNDMNKIKKFVLNEFPDFDIITAGNVGEDIILEFSAIGDSDEEIKQKLDRIAINFRIYFNLVLKRKYGCVYLDFQPLSHTANYRSSEFKETKSNSELNFKHMFENVDGFSGYLEKKISFDNKLEKGLNFVNQNDLFQAYKELVFWLEQHKDEISDDPRWKKFWNLRAAMDHTNYEKNQTAINKIKELFSDTFEFDDENPNELLESENNKRILEKYLPELLDLVNYVFTKHVL